MNSHKAIKTKHTQAEKDCNHACHKAQEKMNTPKGHCYHCKPNTQAREKWEKYCKHGVVCKWCMDGNECEDCNSILETKTGDHIRDDLEIVDMVDWEKDFYMQFCHTNSIDGEIWLDDNPAPPTAKEMIAFISQLLQTQRDELVEKIKDEMEEKDIDETDSQILDRLWDYLDFLTSNKEGEE